MSEIESGTLDLAIVSVETGLKLLDMWGVDYMLIILKFSMYRCVYRGKINVLPTRIASIFTGGQS